MMDDNVKQTIQNFNFEKWKGLVADFNNSNMKIDDWCRLNRIGKSTYYKYQRLVRDAVLNEKSLSETAKIKPKFVPVITELLLNESVIILKGNIRIEVNSNSNLDTIVNMIMYFYVRYIKRLKSRNGNSLIFSYFENHYIFS